MSGAFFGKRPARRRRSDWMILPVVAVFALALSLSQLFAGGAEIVGVEARKTDGNSWTFDVTVRHDDEGWDHYADRWEVLGPDGALLGERVLAHPHVNEQPFTRSQSGIDIPADMAVVTVRARDSVHGFEGEAVTVTLDQGAGTAVFP